MTDIVLEYAPSTAMEEAETSPSIGETIGAIAHNLFWNFIDLVTIFTLEDIIMFTIVVIVVATVIYTETVAWLWD